MRKKLKIIEQTNKSGRKTIQIKKNNEKDKKGKKQNNENLTNNKKQVKEQTNE